MLDTSLFYRWRAYKENNDSDSTTVDFEFFIFEDREMRSVGIYTHTYPLDVMHRGRLLNRRYWICASFAFLLDLEQDKVFRLDGISGCSSGFVHEGALYKYNMWYMRVEAKLILSSAPHFSSEHALYSKEIHAFDVTPSDSRFVMDCDTDEIKQRTSIVRFNGSVFSKEFSRYFHGQNTLKDCDIVALGDGKIYSYIRGKSVLVPFILTEAKGFFTVNSTNHLNQIAFGEVDENSRLLWDFYSNRLEVFEPFLEGSVLLESVTRCYDKDMQRWRVCTVTNSENMFFLYIDGINKSTHPRCEGDASISSPTFNHRIEAFCRRKGSENEVIIGGSVVANCKLGRFKLCQNTLWVQDHQMIQFISFDEHCNIKDTQSVVFNESVVCISSVNDYAPEEALIRTQLANGAQFYYLVRYCEDDDDLVVMDIGVFSNIPFFFGPGAIYAYCKEVYWFNTLGGKTTLSVPEFTEGYFFSPRPNVIVWSTSIYLKDFMYSFYITTFNSDCDGYELLERKIDVLEYLSNCEVSIFSGFSCFGVFM
ncbi:hypothetical protein PCE1_004738 [Barthelona sp. PCE]